MWDVKNFLVNLLTIQGLVFMSQSVTFLQQSVTYMSHATQKNLPKGLASIVKLGRGTRPSVACEASPFKQRG